jgi:hypothetical protein
MKARNRCQMGQPQVAECTSALPAHGAPVSRGQRQHQPRRCLISQPLTPGPHSRPIPRHALPPSGGSPVGSSHRRHPVRLPFVSHSLARKPLGFIKTTCNLGARRRFHPDPSQKPKSHGDGVSRGEYFGLTRWALEQKPMSASILAHVGCHLKGPKCSVRSTCIQIR